MNYRMDISYDGTKYKGWQRQKSTSHTIQGKIEEILSKYFDEKVLITAASRTDAGVHAKMQVINFKTDKQVDTVKLRADINRYLPKDIIIKDVIEADERFHSRFNALKKTYLYTIWKCDAKYPPLFNKTFPFRCNLSN